MESWYDHSDAAGNVDWIKDYLACSSYPLQDSTYDLLNCLDAASATGGNVQELYHENDDNDSQGNLWKKGVVGSETLHTYLDSNHKHAVTHLGGAQKYWYHANGNMTTRVAGATSYTQGWDAENRLVSYNGTSAMVASPNNGGFYDTGYTATSPEMRFQVEFHQTGTYYVWIWPCASSASDDSAHIGLEARIAGLSTGRLSGKMRRCNCILRSRYSL